MIRVLIASPSGPLAGSLAAQLRNAPGTLVIGATESVVGALVALRRTNADVLLMDGNLPEAMRLWSQLKLDRPDLRVVVMAANPQQQEGWRVAGAQAALVKDFSARQLRETIFEMAV